MSYNGSGTFNINTAGQPVVDGTVISSSVFNALTADLGTGLTTAITKDGQTTPTANIPLGTFKITGLGAGTAATDAVRMSQLQAGGTTFLTAAGTDTITATATPSLTAYATGNLFTFVVAVTNTGAVTLNIDGLGAKAVTRDGTTALAANDLVATEVVIVGYDGTRFQVLNPNAATNYRVSGTLGVTGVATMTAAPVFSSATASQAMFTDGSKALVSNAITGTGNVVMSASPTLTGTIAGANQTLSGTLGVTGVATLGNGAILNTPASMTGTNITGTAAAFNINGTVGATTPAAGAFTTITASSTLGVTGVSTFAAGSAAAPSITTTGDTNTGIFFPAADTIGFSEGGAEAMRINSGGLVGIGLTSYSLPLSVVADANGQNIQINGRTGDSLVQMFFRTFGGANNLASISSESTGSLYFGTGSQTAPTVPTERARITSGGQFCVSGTTALQSANVSVHGTIACETSGVDGTYQNGIFFVYSSNNNEHSVIKSSVSSTAGNSGLQFMISDGGGLSTVTESFRINRTSCAVIGSLSKGSGSFKIDHPLKPNTHHLVHSFIEGPQADLIYRGKVVLVNGRAEVNIDTVAGMTEGTFVALCREVQCFTSNESDWDAVRGSVSGNKLTIECQNQSSSAVISWLVIGERQDKHMYETEWTDENGKVIVEPAKVAALESK